MSKWTKDAIEAPHTQRWMGGTAQPVALELVAWLTECLDSCSGCYGGKRRITDARKFDVSSDAFWINPETKAQHKITPLYAHPAAPAPVEAGLRQSIVDLLDCWDMFGLDEIKASLTKYADRAQPGTVGGEVKG